MRSRSSRYYLLSILVLLSMLSAIPSASSQASVTGYCMNAEIANIVPSSVKVGEEFTLGVTIQNCGNKRPTDINFAIVSLPEDITVSEPLSRSISNVYYNSERFLNYHFRVSPNASPGTHVIKMRLTYGDGNAFFTEDYEVAVDVIGSEGDLGITTIKTTPRFIHEGDMVEMDLTVNNFGKGTAKDVKVYIDANFTGVKEQYIGALNSNESGTAVLKFKVDRAGDIEVPVRIGYRDDYGQNLQETTIRMTVLEKNNRLNIASVKSNPVLPKEGDSVELTLRIENIGEVPVNSVKVYLDHPFTGTREAFIGTLKSGSDGPALFVFNLDSSGEYTIPVNITYSDDIGMNEISTEVRLVVLPKESNAASVFSIVLLLAVFSGIIYRLVLKNKKNEDMIRNFLKRSK